MTRKAPCCAISCLRRIKLMFFALVIFIFSEIKHINWLFPSCLRWEVSGVFFMSSVYSSFASTARGKKGNSAEEKDDWHHSQNHQWIQTVERTELIHWKKKRWGELQLSVEQGKDGFGLNHFLVSTNSYLSQREFMLSKRSNKWWVNHLRNTVHSGCL